MAKLSRSAYIKEYKSLGKKMFSTCTIPNVYTFANAYVNKNTDAINQINTIAKFAGSEKKLQDSVNKREERTYSEEESKHFMKSVIAANVTDITQSGYFYKKLMSSADDMTIDIEDCGSEGVEFTCPVEENVFNYKIRNHWVMELGKYVESYKDLPKKGTIHVRTFLTCNHGLRHFCKKCAGIFRRSYDTEFTPNYIGLYSTLMITEHATQSSLDSMNKDGEKKVNVLLEQNLSHVKTLEEAKAKINEIIDTIGNVGVESRFYEVALLSRWRNGKFASLQNSFLYQEDKLGSFIYSSSKNHFYDMIKTGSFEGDSTKTKIAFDAYDRGMD